MARVSYSELESIMVGHDDKINILLDFTNKDEVISKIYDILGFKYKICSINYDALYDVLTDTSFREVPNRNKDLYLYLMGDHWFYQGGVFTDIFTDASKNNNIYIIFVDDKIL